MDDVKGTHSALGTLMLLSLGETAIFVPVAVAESIVSPKGATFEVSSDQRVGPQRPENFVSHDDQTIVRLISMLWPDRDDRCHHLCSQLYSPWGQTNTGPASTLPATILLPPATYLTTLHAGRRDPPSAVAPWRGRRVRTSKTTSKTTRPVSLSSRDPISRPSQVLLLQRPFGRARLPLLNYTSASVLPLLRSEGGMKRFCYSFELARHGATCVYSPGSGRGKKKVNWSVDASIDRSAGRQLGVAFASAFSAFCSVLLLRAVYRCIYPLCVVRLLIRAGGREPFSDEFYSQSGLNCRGLTRISRRVRAIWEE